MDEPKKKKGGNPYGNPLWVPGKSANPNGRPAGSINKLTRDLRDMISAALDRSGGVDYLVQQAKNNPVAFLTLLGKIIPTELSLKIKEMPRAMVYPDGLPKELNPQELNPITIENDERLEVPLVAETVDRIH